MKRNRGPQKSVQGGRPGPVTRPSTNLPQRGRVDDSQPSSGIVRERRALSHQGGHTERTGEPQLADTLAQALCAPMEIAGPATANDLTHGFHSYPARMHPAIARHVLATLVTPHSDVLDPFCGSGTVLVEALVAGHRAYGVDLNPLARRIAEVQCRPWPENEREKLWDVIEKVAAASEARVRGRVKIRAPLPAAEIARYSSHILLELAGLLAEIQSLADADQRRVLEVVFSSMVVKFSNQRADTSDELVERRLRKGLVTEFFLRKSEELLGRWAALEQAMPADAAPVRLMEGDARQLPKVLRKGTRIDLVLTSPPYGGTYDYVEHHARRYPWLGLQVQRFESSEIGARRRLQGADAIVRWDAELGDSLKSMARVCRPGALIVLLLGDAHLAGERIDAAAQLAALAPRCGLTMLASAAQLRPDFQGGPPRREHLIGLRVPHEATLKL